MAMRSVFLEFNMTEEASLPLSAILLGGREDEFAKIFVDAASGNS
jgi:hypothetical protein